MEYAPGWDRHFKDLDKSVKLRVLKKLEQLKAKADGRHLEHWLPYFVEEVAGYRIAYKTVQATNTRRIYFVGDHKEYERWFKEGA